MKPSDEFFSFCSGLHQDFDLYGPKLEDWIDGALGFFPPGRLPVLRDYIAGLLAGNYSDAELQKLYRSTFAALAIWKDEDVRPFFGIGSRQDRSENITISGRDHYSLKKRTDRRDAMRQRRS